METVVTFLALYVTCDLDLLIIDDGRDLSIADLLFRLDVHAAHIRDGLLAGAPCRVEGVVVVRFHLTVDVVVGA